MRIVIGTAGILLAMDSQVIAIVDDDALVRDGVQRLVNSMNFRAEQFSSIDHFLAFEGLHDVRCVICDVQTGAGTAESLLHCLMSIAPDIPVVFMTARPTAALRTKLLGAGALHVLTKPFHQNEMASCIAAALQRPPSTRQRKLSDEERHSNELIQRARQRSVP